jgi:hypothetical protein
MKKNLFILPLLTMLLSCQQKENQSENNAIDENLEACGRIEINGESRDFYAMSKADFNALESHEFNFPADEIIDDKENVKRTDSLLSFTLTNGEKLKLRDVYQPDYADVLIFSYVKSYEDILYWLYNVTYYEGSGMFLLDKDNGEKINLWGMPVFSPDKSHFVTNSIDIVAGYQPNGMQLFEIQDGKVSLVWKFEISDEWGPEKVRWIDNETIAIQKSSMDYESQDHSYKSEYVKLRIQ